MLKVVKRLIDQPLDMQSMAGWTPRGHQVISRSHWCNMQEGQFQSTAGVELLRLDGKKKTVVYKLGFTKNIKLFKYKHIDHTASPPPQRKDFWIPDNLHGCIRHMYSIKWKSKASPSGPADRELSTSRQQTNQNRTERKTTRSLIRGKKDVRCFTFKSKRWTTRGQKQRNKHTEQGKQRTGGRRTEEKLTADI